MRQPSGGWQLAEYRLTILNSVLLAVWLMRWKLCDNLASGGIRHYSIAYIDLNSKIEHYVNIWQLMEWPSGYWRNMTLLYCKLINSRVALSIVPLFGTGMRVEWLFIVPPLGVMLIGIFLIHSHPWKQCFPCLPITSYISNLLHPWKQCFPCLPPIQLRYVIRNSNQLRMWHFQLHFIYIVGRWLVIESYFGWEMIGQVRHGVVAWYVYQVNYPNSVHLPFKLLLWSIIGRKCQSEDDHLPAKQCPWTSVHRLATELFINVTFCGCSNPPFALFVTIMTERQNDSMTLWQNSRAAKEPAPVSYCPSEEVNGGLHTAKHVDSPP